MASPCPFLQWSLPSLQWPDSRAATLMNYVRRTSFFALIWLVNSICKNPRGDSCGHMRVSPLANDFFSWFIWETTNEI
jgi:hypothetical protein